MKKETLLVSSLIFYGFLITCIIFFNNGINNNKQSTSKVDDVTYPNVFSQYGNVKLEHSIYYLKVGETEEIKVLSNNSDLLVWSSSNDKVASVDSNGIIKGISIGRVNVFAMLSSGEYAYVEVVVCKDKKETKKADIKNNRVPEKNNNYNVIKPANNTNNNPSNNQKQNNNNTPGKQNSGTKQDIAVKSITLSSTNVKVGTGSSSSYKIKATVYPNNATNKNITWSSSDKGVATINNNGVIKGIHSGTTKVTARANNGVVASATVVVTSTERIHFIPQKESINDTKSKGDAILLESNGHFALIDTGGTNNISRENLVTYLKKFGIKEGGIPLDFVLLTHYHPDHVGGIKKLLSIGIKVDILYMKRYSESLGDAYSTFKSIKECADGTNKNCLKTRLIKYTQTIDNAACPNSSNQAHSNFNCVANIGISNMKINLYNTAYVMKKGNLGPDGNHYKAHKKDGNGYETINLNYESIYEYIKVNGHKIVLASDALGDYTGTSLDNVLFESDRWFSRIMNDTGTGIDILKAPHHGDYNSDKNFSKLKPKSLVVTNSYNAIKNNTSGIKDYSNSHIYYVEYYERKSDLKTLYADLSGSKVTWGRIAIYK